MVPLIVAGLAVMGAATVVGWIYNTLTEEEKEKQRQERNRGENIRARAQRERERQNGRYSDAYREMVEDKVKLLLATITSHRSRIEQIPEGLADLKRVIQEEALKADSSPYRKSALRREFTRIEDAIRRYDEYIHYLDQEERQTQADFETSRFDAILERDIPEPLLPLEWLYVGKLVLVSLEEINRPLPRFRHQIVFLQREEISQKALAVRYGDEIPILIKEPHRKWERSFVGCVARGALYVDHIQAREPVAFTVERVLMREKRAHGSLFGGLVLAELPLAELKFPGVRLAVGQRIQVHPKQYDLCLTRDPFSTDSRKKILVSESDYGERSVQAYQQIYIAIQEEMIGRITDEGFFDPHRDWYLLGYSSSTGIIHLGRSNVLLACKALDDYKMLTVIDVQQKDALQVGLDSPFRFSLISQEFIDTVDMAWVQGVTDFLSFCAQAVLDMELSSERIAQSRFFQQWHQVIAYQRTIEEISAIEFPIANVVRDGDMLTVQSDKLAVGFELKDFEQVQAKMAEVQSESNNLKDEHCFKLLQWNSQYNDFRPALKADSRTRPIFTRTADTISIQGDLSAIAADAQLLRLQITISSPALRRQEQALQDFFNDYLVNPALKNILLSPERYLPSRNEVQRPIQWHGQLDDSQKRVVELALNERNIALIQGPPGAGKTTAIVEMLLQLFLQQPECRVLVVSQQNSAVDNALVKFLDMNQEKFKLPIQAIRIGNQEKMAMAVLPYSLEQRQSEFVEALDSRAIEAAVSMDAPENLLAYKWSALLKAAKLNTRDRSMQEELFVTLLSDKNLVGATCVGLANNKGGVDQLQFDVAIIDEAGRATAPEILIPILRSQKVILVGDHYQLPPSIAPLLREDAASEQLTFLRENFLSGSFFEMMFERLPPYCREILNKQYRMAPAIGNLVAEVFYSPNGKRTLFNGHPDCHFDGKYLLERSIYWVNVDGKQKLPPNSTSLENPQEAQKIAHFLKNLSNKVNRRTSVAVITAYGSQKKRILRELAKIGCKENEMGLLNVDVDTVDAFQGSEADVVCYSTVRTHGDLEFILDRKRLNVACSRARLHLVFFGKSRFLQLWRPRQEGKENLFPRIMQYASFKPITFQPQLMKQPEMQV
ncbi:DEAD/DEAH box helicase [Aeromonas sanarellii]